MPTAQVGAGKSSILAALLGELQPVGSGGAAAGKGSSSTAGGAGKASSPVGAGPLVAGSVAYCCQVPWVVAGTVQVGRRPAHGSAKCDCFQSSAATEALGPDNVTDSSQHRLIAAGT
jgi:hypothetical protein